MAVAGIAVLIAGCELVVGPPPAIATEGDAIHVALSSTELDDPFVIRTDRGRAGDLYAGPRGTFFDEAAVEADRRKQALPAWLVVLRGGSDGSCDASHPCPLPPEQELVIDEMTGQVLYSLVKGQD